MSISLLSNIWQPAAAALASFGADATTPSATSSSASAPSSGAAPPTSGVSFAQIASELQTVLLQLQEGGSDATPGSSGSTGTDSTTGEASGTHHHHHHHAAGSTQQAGTAASGSPSGVGAGAELANALASVTF